MTTAEKTLRAKQDFDDVYNAGYEKGKAEGGGGDTSLLDSLIDRTITSIESNVTTIGDDAFYKCSNLTSAFFPNAVTIRNSAFHSCALTSIVFPNAVSLGQYCFAACASLETAEFNKCESIGRLGFYQDRKLTKLIIRTEKVATLLSSDALTQTPIANGTGYIYVSDDLVESYKSATNWSTYANQIKGLSELEEVTEE